MRAAMGGEGGKATGGDRQTEQATVRERVKLREEGRAVVAGYWEN